MSLLALLSLLFASPSVGSTAAFTWTPVVAAVSAVVGIPSLAGVPAAVSLQLLMFLDAGCYLTIGKFKFRNFVADLLSSNL
jgi:hypothetical protein